MRVASCHCWFWALCSTFAVVDSHVIQNHERVSRNLKQAELAPRRVLAGLAGILEGRDHVPKPDLVGRIDPSLETEGHPPEKPFPDIPSLDYKILKHTFATFGSMKSEDSSNTLSNESGLNITREPPSVIRNPARLGAKVMTPAGSVDCFQAIASQSIPSVISSRNDHPVPRLGIKPQSQAVPTNKFYANLFLGNQNQGVWTHPYSVTWSKGGGNLKSWGLAISHIDANQRAFGDPQPDIPRSPVRYFINPLGIYSIILSAAELGPDTQLTTDSLRSFSVNANLLPSSGSASSIQFPLIQGMGFVTSIYNNLTPLIQSSVFFRAFSPKSNPQAGVFKYSVTLEDGKIWLIYIIPANGKDPNLRKTNSTELRGPSGFSGTIQIAKLPTPDGEASYDASAGVYAVSATIKGNTIGSVGTYSLSWSKAGLTNNVLLMHALPHHLSSISSLKTSTLTPIKLQTTTKGVATGILADSWLLREPSLPSDIGFAPWKPVTGSRTQLSAATKSSIWQIAQAELSQDMDAQSNLDSMYFAGKALSKFAVIVLTVNDLLQDSDLAAKGLTRLKASFARFTSNKQIYPLVQDTAWGGIVSSGSYVTHDANMDFGNTYYNDHHFHFSYFIHAAAIIGSLDPSWLQDNAPWVNTLVRDASNPVDTDTAFPFSRAFDWFHGHSFAKGLYESGDSKDEESTSEDAFFAYAIKMWGQVTGDKSMEARGNLMLGIMARTLNSYFLMRNNNMIQPSQFIANKVTGILFENKVDHTTYFGSNYEYIQGIHMLPLNPSTAYTRSAAFIAEEWQAYFADNAFHAASRVVGGWKGILYGNLACISPNSAWRFFSQSNFDVSWLDGGASRTYYMAFSAALAGL